MLAFSRPFACSGSSLRLYSLVKNIRTFSLEQQDGKFANFDHMISFYMHQARNSVLIRAPGYLSHQRLDDLLRPVTGPISVKQIKCYRHTFNENKESYYYLCELGRTKINTLSNQLGHDKHNILPTRMRLWKISNPFVDGALTPNARAYEDEVNPSRLTLALSAEHSLDDQMNRLVDETELKPTGVAVRFFVASLMEDLFSGIFPLSACLPFGSTISGLGKKGGDLDMAIEFQDTLLTPGNQRKLTKQLSIVYRTFGESNDRVLIQKTLDIYAALLANMVPFCSEVQRVLHARVPIVKFRLALCNLSCDLTTNNHTGVEMAKILWLYCQLDRRTKPLLFTIRLWAKCASLTHSVPGAWLTNFQLTCLVLFFMQNRAPGTSCNAFKEPTLPSINVLRSAARLDDLFGLISDPSKLPHYQLLNSHSDKRPLSGPGRLLRDFFDFYSSLNFECNALCLNSGKRVEMPVAASPIYIINPLDASLNISKNVSAKSVSDFVRLCHESLSLIQAAAGPTSHADAKMSAILPQLFNIAEFKATSSREGSSFSHEHLINESDSVKSVSSNPEVSNKEENFVGQSKFVLSDLLREEFDDLDSLGKKRVGK